MMTGVDDIFVLPFVGPQECLKATCAQFTLRLNAKDGVIDLETNSEVDAGRISPGAFVGCSRASKSRRSAMLCAARGLREPQGRDDRHGPRISDGDCDGVHYATRVAFQPSQRRRYNRNSFGGKGLFTTRTGIWA